MKRLMSIRRLAVLASASLVVSVVPSGSVLAAGTSCGSLTVSGYGTIRQASTENVTYLAGVQAHVTARVSDLCTSITDNTNTSSQWVMLAGSGSTDGRAQNGDIRHAGGCDCKQFFYEAEPTSSSTNGPFFIPNSGSNSLPWGAPANGTTYTYKTTWQDGGDNTIHFIFCSGTNCVDYAHTSWNPSGKGWSGADAQLFEETHYHLSDLAGTQADKATFDTIMLRKHVSGGGGPWYDVSSLSACTSADGSTACGSTYWRYHLDMLNSNTAFDDYTCPLDPSKTC